MAQVDNEVILAKLQRIVETQDRLREDVSNLRDRMSSLEMMLGTQMTEHGHMLLRMNRLEEMARQAKSNRPEREPDPLPELH